MTVNWTTTKKLALPSMMRGLSARLLVLTIFFVMLAELFIYAPSIGRFRLVYLEERLAAANLAILAMQAAPDHMVSEDMEVELMTHVGAYSVALNKPEAGKLVLMVEYPPAVPLTFDLRKGTFFGLIGDAFDTLISDGSRLIRVIGHPPKDPEALLEIVMKEGPLRVAMLDYSKRILALSLGISIFTAGLVFLSLHLLMVRPMRRMTASMAAFREDPENASQAIQQSERSDEVGVAQRELATMQEELRAALLQKTRLAALGTAVTKINHDLRNILATASLVS
ncbi:MAG: sensor histidine kinase, partial [Pseudomonadota bacterium]